MTDSVPTAATTRVPGRLQCRIRIPAVAQKQPAVTNSRSPPTPCLPMVVNDSKPNTSKPPMIAAAPNSRCGVIRSRKTKVARTMPNSAAQAGWMVVP